MFKKFLASLNIGAATVDTQLAQSTVFPGQLIEGEVKIQGGKVEQEIKDIYLKVITQYKQEIDDHTEWRDCVLVKYFLAERFLINPEEIKVIPFSLQLPEETPLTFGNQPVYIRTGLDISVAIDPRDTDHLEVIPHPDMEKVFTAMNNLGFSLTEVECEYSPHWGNYPFVQEFEFRPTGRFRQSLDELEIIFKLNQEFLEVFLQVDKRARGFQGWLEESFNLDEAFHRFVVYEGDSLSTVENKLLACIENSL